MVAYIWVNIGSGNGWLPDSKKPSPEPMESFKATSMKKESTGVLYKEMHVE